MRYLNYFLFVLLILFSVACRADSEKVMAENETLPEVKFIKEIEEIEEEILIVEKEYTSKESETKFLDLIKELQKKHVFDSFGKLSGECFTDRDLEYFLSMNISANIYQDLIEDSYVQQIVMSIENWDVFKKKALNYYERTWSENGVVSRAGQTMAGSEAEKLIAEAVVKAADKIIREN